MSDSKAALEHGRYSRRSWASGSLRDPSDPFRHSTCEENGRDDDESLLWATLEKLPTYERMRKGILCQSLGGGKGVAHDVDVRHLGMEDRKILMDNILKVVQEDNEYFLLRLRERIDRVGLELPQIEVRYENLSVEAETYIGGRALPTLLNATMNTIEDLLGFVRLFKSKKRLVKMLNGVSGILKPSRMTLLLGPPRSGKTTLLLALAGKLEKKLRVSGNITYCGHQLSEFVPQRTCAYISQFDLHNGEMTVRETLDFSGRCLGVGARYEMMSELIRREKEAGIKPDPEIDAFMKSTAMGGQRTNLATDYIIKVLGLDICADILVGDEMRRGISGGQKKRVTTGEMLAGPARALFMDEISTGLDSSTTFQIVKFIRQMVHVMDGTVFISLLQPEPETFNLFDDVILLSEGQIVYQGPRDNILEFFEYMGFKCPERKGVADFLQEVSSKKDQEQYWFVENQPYCYISVTEFVESFKTFSIGQELAEVLKRPYDKSKSHPAALATERYGLATWDLLKACFSREWLLMKRNSSLYIFKTTQITIMSVVTMTVFLRTGMHHETIGDGGKYFGALFYSLLTVMFNGTAEIALTVYKLPVFYKQRDFFFFPPWAFGIVYCLLKIPLSVMESGIWIILTYYVIGYAPAPSRFFRQFLAYFCTHQMSLAMFRLIGAAGRTMVVATTFSGFVLLIVFVLGGFVIIKDDIQPWWIWGYWSSPMMYAQNALAVNEFLDPRWDSPNNDASINASTIGKAILKSRGMFMTASSYWVCIGALIASAILFNTCFILMLTHLNPPGNSGTSLVNEDPETKNKKGQLSKSQQMFQMTGRNPPSAAHTITATEVPATQAINNHRISNTADRPSRRGMVLPFQPLSLTFNHVNYYVDMPAEMKSQGINERRLQLLCDVSGAFRPGVMTALVGVSGAGKTTLMDVLAGRKTGGYTEGSISISGYPKRQETFTRISGYCEQNDIHSPHVTVYESLVYSTWLRLAPEVDRDIRKMFVEEVMELVELNLLRDALVGLPGVDGLSTGQRKRLTIAVELVSNPSIIFMDEPTSGLDARAAAIVMRTVRNTVDTGRTVVCTIHQPSIDIFEAFDELLMMKRGGQVIYAGSLGRNSLKLIEYFEAVPGVPKISERHNPAAWMLDITSTSAEGHLNLDFAEVYFRSSLYQKNQELIKELNSPLPDSKDLYFPTEYPQSFSTQCMTCLWKQHLSYWRNPPYNAIRFFMTLTMALLLGTIFWDSGRKIHREQELSNLLGGIYAALMFLGSTNAFTVQPVLAIERTVFYRERAAGMYSPLSYALAQVSIELIYVLAQSLVYGVILFSMLGFDWQAEKFFWFLYFIFMCFAYFTLYGMVAVALTPNYQIAAIPTAFFLSFWILFSGFVVARSLMPIWWRWCYWTSPVAWTIYGVVASQVGDIESLLTIPGEPSMSVKAYLKTRLGFEHSFLGNVAMAHAGFVVLLTFLFACAFKYLNFQKR